MGQELRADGSANGEIDGNGKQNAGDAERDVAMHDCGANRGAIVGREPHHDGVVPLFGALAEKEAGHYRSHGNGEDNRADEGEADGPGHGLEEPALDGLQGEDGQVGGDDNAAGEKDRAQHLVSGVADFLRRGAGVVLERKVAHHVLDHDHRAIDDHSEVQRTQREQIRGNVAQVKADGGEHKRKRNGEGDNDGAAHIAQEEKKDDRNQDHAFSQVVFDGFDGVGNKV